MMNKHTPEPWVAKKTKCENDSGGFFDIDSTDGHYIAEPIGWHKSLEEEANARLIAAAPELLEACRAMLACCYDMERNDETLAAVKATMKAIAKATGENQ